MKFLTTVALFASLILADQVLDDSEAKGRKPCCARKEPSFDCGDGCGGCFKNYIQKMDFYHTKPILEGQGKNWMYFAENTPIETSDGIFTADCHGGKVDSSVFTRWVPPSGLQSIDNPKFFILAMTPAQVPKNGDLVIEFEGSGETFRGDQNPFPKEITQPNDLRFANSFFITYDFTTQLATSFALTNDRVYAVYTRYTIGRDEESPYAAFSFVIPVKMRRSCDYHNMKLVYHGTDKQISWRLEGREVFRVTKPGYLLDRQYMTLDYGGAEGPIFPQSVYYGFGTASIVQSYPACKRSDSCCDCKFPTVRQALTNTGNATAPALYNPLLGPDNAAIYWQSNNVAADAVATDFIWGQGATLSIKKLVVYQDLCAGRKC